MRTLGEIIEAAKSGERPDYDELRLAVCAMDALMTFDRVKRAMAKTPREYLGENYDPDSPAVQERRLASIALMDKFIDKAKEVV